MIAPGSRYVALGSSYAAGPGIPPIIHRGALRSGRNYPHQVAQALSLELTDVTSSGATTANILDTPQHTLSGTFPPQVSAVTADTRLVTVTAGGNDAGYIGALTKLSVANAVGRRLPGAHLRASAWLAAWAGTAPPPSAFVHVADGLAEVVRAVRSRAPQVQVVLVDYLTVVETEPAGARSGRGALPLTPEQARQVEIAGAGLAAAFERAASVTGAGLVRASLESAGHGASSADPWVTGLKFGNPLTGGAAPWHPNLAGATAVARLVVAYLSG